MLPRANPELPKSEEFERDPEFPANELPNDPRIFESVRDVGTTLRASGAFSQT
jgi:hypothetical protein